MAANKKGLTTLMLIAFVITCLALLIILGVMSWGFGAADEALSQISFTVGNQSFQEIYNQTLKEGIDQMETNVPVTLSMGIILGYILLMMLVGYNTKKLGKLWILLDLAIIIVAEILTSIISSSFVSYINSTPELLIIYSTTLSTASRFVINLPITIGVIGVLIMIVTYISFNKSKEEGQIEAF